jgi:putative NADH-flavin reductase
VFLRETDAKLTLYLRRASRLKNPDPQRVTIVDGDVLESATLKPAMQGQDVVYANLAGDMKRQAAHIIYAMRVTGVRRLIFISSMASTAKCPASVPEHAGPVSRLGRRPRGVGPRLHDPATGLVHE